MKHVHWRGAALIVLLLGSSVVGVPSASAAPRVSTAARHYHWGKPSWSDGFTGTRLKRDWAVYDSPGHAGNGKRRPSRVSLHDGVLTQFGTRNATTAGMVLDHHSHAYGRWETRVRSTSSGHGHPYHSVTALIPGGNAAYHCGARDIDYDEFDVGEPAYFFAHALPDRQHYTHRKLKTSAWHTFAVEITKTHMSWFVDGKIVMTDRDRSIVSRVALAPNFQLDANYSSGLAPAKLQVDWVRYYPLRGRTSARAARAPQHGRYDGAC